jgi:tRNA(adenine34) deaminase
LIPVILFGLLIAGGKAMSENHTKFMCEAVIEAEQALNEGQFPVGAVVVLSGEIVSRRHKFRGCIPRIDHAEKLALEDLFRKGKYDGSDLTVYSSLEPCTMCFGLMMNLRIANIVYALEDPSDGHISRQCDHGDMVQNRAAHHPSIESGVMRGASRGLFVRYFDTHRSAFWHDRHYAPFLRLCRDGD